MNPLLMMLQSQFGASGAAPQGRSQEDILAELAAEARAKQLAANAMNDADIVAAKIARQAASAGGPYGPGGGGYKGVGLNNPLPDPKLPQAAPNFGQTAAEAQADYVGSRKDASAMARQRIEEMVKRGEIQRDMSFVGPNGPGKYTSSSGNVLDVGINRKGGYNVIGNAREQYMEANGGQEPPVSAGVSQRQQAVRDRKDPEKFADRKASGLAKQARLQDMRDPMGAPQRQEMDRQRKAQALVESVVSGGSQSPLAMGIVASQMGLNPSVVMESVGSANNTATLAEEAKRRAMLNLLETLPPGPERTEVQRRIMDGLGVGSGDRTQASAPLVGLEPTNTDGSVKPTTQMVGDLMGAIKAGNISENDAVAKAEEYDRTRPQDARKKKVSAAEMLRATLKTRESLRTAPVSTGIELMY